MNSMRRWALILIIIAAAIGIAAFLVSKYRQITFYPGVTAAGLTRIPWME